MSMSDFNRDALWLIEGATLDGLSLPAGATCWHGTDGAPDRAYAAASGDTPPDGSGWQPLARLQSLAGASAGASAPWHYVVETDVDEADADDLLRWYAEEHLPGLAAVPGTVQAARYWRQQPGDGPRHVACYLLERPDVLKSAPWLAVRHTAWSSRVRPTFRNTRRLMFRAP